LAFIRFRPFWGVVAIRFAGSGLRADAKSRRRRVHDGAQARLLAMGMTLDAAGT
jgi:hypothetical protein